MINDIRKYCEDVLKSGNVIGILGIKEENGHFAPYLFTKADELSSLSISKKYPLLYTCRPAKENLLKIIQKKYPGKKIALVARGCDERALFEISKRFQIKLEDIEIIGYACDKDQAIVCSCPVPYTNKNLKFGQKIDGVPEHPLYKQVQNMSPEEKTNFWKKQFSKCIKCYGCRNLCPVCFCLECRMEQQEYTEGGKLPPEFPLFHFVQRYHHAVHCIECGQCEEACPMDIPLRLISKELLGRVKELYDYMPGLDPKQEPPIESISENTN